MTSQHAWALIGRALAVVIPELQDEILTAAAGSSAVGGEPSELPGVMIVEARCARCGHPLRTIHVRCESGYVTQDVIQAHTCAGYGESTTLIRFRAPATLTSK